MRGKKKYKLSRLKDGRTQKMRLGRARRENYERMARRGKRRRERRKRGSWMKGRVERSRGIETLLSEALATLFGKRKPSFWKEKMGAKRRCHAPVAPCGSVHHVSAGVGEEGRGRAQKGGGGGIGGSVGEGSRHACVCVHVRECLLISFTWERSKKNIEQ